MFFIEFFEYLEFVVFFKENLLILGDFNIYVDNIYDFDVIKFLDFLEFFGFK